MLVALVDFGELAAGAGGNGPPAVVAGGPKVRLWRSCRYEQRQVGRLQIVNWNVLGGCGPVGGDSCPDGPGLHWEGSDVVTDCRSGAAMTMTPTGIVMTHGWNDQIARQEGDGHGTWWEMRYRRGSITLDNVTIVQSKCAEEQWWGGDTLVYEWQNPYHQAVGVCCSYEWDRPEPACPPSPPKS